MAEMVKTLKLWLGIIKPCNHRWRIMIENYPTFTKNYWCCTRCDKWKVFQHDAPPVKIKTEICSLGHVHIINGR